MAEAHPIPSSPCFINLTGDRYGQLTVVSFAGHKNKRRQWNCLCDCGVERVIPAQSLRSGATISCGCYGRAKARTHGMSKTKTFGCWEHMLARCNNPNEAGYENYGGRGIVVCERWYKFENFFADMGICPEGDYSIDRIDSNGNYEPGNCRWADRATQNRNHSRNHKITFNGETLCLTDWAHRLGMKPNVLGERLRRYGWSVEEALTTPRRKRGHNRLRRR